MMKTQRGFKVAAMTLSLLTASVMADSGNLYGQSHSTHNSGSAVMQPAVGTYYQNGSVVTGNNPGVTYNQGTVVMGHGAGTTYNEGTVVTQHGAGCSSCNNAAPAGVVYAQPAPVYTASAASCGCQSGGCTSCQKKKACPKCDCQFCELDVKKGEVEKTSFKTEQKEVCVPAVRLPWKKNCPPTRSKVRTVNVLKKHKYKCPKCEYNWNVHEPEDFSSPTPAKSSAASKTAAPAKSGSGTKSLLQNPAEAFGDVPRPPLEGSK